jgi:hypothetical protein
MWFISVPLRELEWLIMESKQLSMKDQLGGSAPGDDQGIGAGAGNLLVAEGFSAS